MGTSIGYPLTLNNNTLKKWFGKGEKKDTKTNNTGGEDNSSSNADENLSDNNTSQKPASLLQKKKAEGDYDEDGYLLTNIPWNLSLNYNFSYGYGAFNKEKREYDYRVMQTLSLSGNISPTKAWNFSFSTSYDFDHKRFATMTCNITRQMHCWQMSASIIPIGPYTSYTFRIAVSASILKDLKYDQSSNFRDQMNWGN